MKAQSLTYYPLATKLKLPSSILRTVSGMITKYIYKLLMEGFYSPNRVVVTGSSFGRQRDIVHRGVEVEKMYTDRLKLKRWEQTTLNRKMGTG